MLRSVNFFLSLRESFFHSCVYVLCFSFFFFALLCDVLQLSVHVSVREFARAFLSFVRISRVRFVSFPSFPFIFFLLLLTELGAFVVSCFFLFVFVCRFASIHWIQNCCSQRQCIGSIECCPMLPLPLPTRPPSFGRERTRWQS